jgi:hypothetical protein
VGVYFLLGEILIGGWLVGEGWVCFYRWRRFDVYNCFVD